MLLTARLERQEPQTPPHHVLASSAGSSWTSYLPSINPSPPQSRTQRDGGFSLPWSGSKRQKTSSASGQRTGFRNPWKSWHKPTQKEVWDNLQWGEDEDPAIDLAASSLNTKSISKSTPSRSSSTSSKKSVIRRRSTEQPNKDSRSAQAARQLKVVPPDFTFDPSNSRAKVTWLGHASMLVQLPSLSQGGRPFCCLFDPIFSERASPVQNAGPMRFYPPPCKVEDLPAIDVMFLSHNHYDHLDYDTVMALWKNNGKTIRFVVPLDNKQWFVDCGIPEDRVHEMDWWDTMHLSTEKGSDQSIKITCTPSQHQSGRSGLDTDMALWSSWYLEHPQPEAYRVFFAGDTGYQFHASPKWPPSPPTPQATKSGASSAMKRLSRSGDPDDPAIEKYPACPAFQDIVDRLGSPDLLLLPIWVGGTYDFLRSWVPLPDSVSPFPRHQMGLTAANHMPPWDAVRVLRLMTEKKEGVAPRRHAPVAVAMHWGTFITEPVEVLKTLGQLQWACEQQSVRFARSLDADGANGEPSFLALDHGQSIVI